MNEMAVNMLEGVSNAELQYVLGCMKELKDIGRELQALIMEERIAWAEGKSASETKADSELAEIMYENDAKEQANILLGRAQERGVSEKMLDLLSYAITQYI